eukprot:m.43999 g.43999  ORF g.43999 m.43999 type:complete len:774 (+) comp10032_c0_seq1:151-2472(+)
MAVTSELQSVCFLISFLLLGYFSGQRFRNESDEAQRALQDSSLDLKRIQKETEAVRLSIESLRVQVYEKKSDAYSIYHKGNKDVPEKGKRSISQDPTLACKEKRIDANKRRRLPVYVFVCGVEGAGHHAMETVWAKLAKFVDLGVTGYNPGLHSFAKNSTVSRAYQFSTILKSRHEKRFKIFLSTEGFSGKPLLVDARNSFPEGFGVGNLAHPDLVYLSAMDGILFNLRVVLLYRDPTAAVMSSVRRFRVQEFEYKNFEFQARSVQESLTVMNNALAAVPCGQVLLLPYDKLVVSPSTFAPELAKFIGVPHEAMNASMVELRPPSKKAVDDKTEAMVHDLKIFFEQQKSQWPILTGATKLPKLDAWNYLPIPSIKLEASAVKKKKMIGFLKIQFHTNLGFNNVRFILEEGLYIANLLNRRLLLPPKIRMRTCLNDTLCKETDCTKDPKQTNFWCPITSFLAWKNLKDVGAAIVQNEGKFFKDKSQRTIEKAFDEMFNNDNLYLDKIPSKIKKRLNSTGHKDLASPPLRFIFWKFKLGCELSYFEAKKFTWDSSKQKDSQKSIRGFIDEFGDVKETLLTLGGTPHFIGKTPTSWWSEASLRESQAVWDSAVIYNPSIPLMAKVIVNDLVKQGPLASFVCVHLRRGDFAKIGWLGKASDLSLVKRTIESHKEPQEFVYMATDETDDTVLEDFRKIGVRTWRDYESEVLNSKIHNKHYLGFEDYIGLVEQSICAEARVFIGSKCSSFTGGILNLRRKQLGDNRYYTTEGNTVLNGL